MRPLLNSMNVEPEMAQPLILLHVKGTDYFAWLWLPPLRSEPVQPFREAAFLGERGGLGFDLAVQQRIGHADQNKRSVCCKLRVAGLDGRYGRRLGFLPSMRSILSMLLLHPSCHLLYCGTPPRDQRLAAGVMFRPRRQAAVSQVVFVVQLEFFQAGARHVGQLQFHLFRGAAGLAAFGYILHPAARGLHHLIVGTAALFDIPSTKPHRHVVAELRDLKALEFPIAAVFRDERFGFHPIVIDSKPTNLLMVFLLSGEH